MKRLEIIGNQSIRDELISGLERSIPQIEYTLIPLVQGKGRRKRKEGTRTWPETNFYLLLLVDEAGLESSRSVLADLRRRLPNEGLFATVSEAESI